ncbi:hypothetical protein [Agromyces marinus]|uniref:Uncharacterized protein n=1 Tax=Agromyces marinus TaxID=1389020 RepID=A0ABM8H3D7_9MICO|nr:hypothetical protein [Agromyces marinus]BDZ55312.1 hypothetical protein GCM10025870_23850 [Agromyces marinus]
MDDPQATPHDANAPDANAPDAPAPDDEQDGMPDAVCWLAATCDSCGALVEGGTCWNCGARRSG